MNVWLKLDKKLRFLKLFLVWVYFGGMYKFCGLTKQQQFTSITCFPLEYQNTGNDTENNKKK